MGKLRLSVAMGDYDRTRALLDGRVLIDGVEPVFMTLSPEETFFRAMRQQAFDISELSLSSYVVKAARGECPYVAVPVFLSRAFRHTSIWVRKDRIRTPLDLKGKRVGVPEYQLTANVWARAILQDDHGVHPRDITWVRGGIETPGRPEKIVPRAATRGAARRSAGRSHDLRSARRRRHRWLHRAAPTGRRGGAQSAGALVVRRPDRGGQGLVPPHRHLSDHARGRRAP